MNIFDDDGHDVMTLIDYVLKIYFVIQIRNKYLQERTFHCLLPGVDHRCHPVQNMF